MPFGSGGVDLGAIGEFDVEDEFNILSGTAFTPPTIGGTNPLIFADFAANHYWYNGANYGTWALWSTAIGGAFARPSTASFTGQNGLIQTAANNVLRFDFDPITSLPKGILLEGASTNLNLFSDFSGGGNYTPGNGILTVAAATGPDGTLDAATFITNTANNVHALTNNNPATVLSNTTYTCSCYVKPIANQQWLLLRTDGGVGTFINVYSYFDLVNGVTGTLGSGATSASIQKLQNGWFRVQVTGTSGSSDTQARPALVMSNINNGGVSPSYAGDGVSGVACWGLQLEQLAFASSYIPTTTVTVTRAADSYPAASLTFGTTAATVYSKFININNTSLVGGLFALNNGSNTNRIDMRVGTGSGSPQSIVTSGGTGEATLALSAFNPGTTYKAAISASVAQGAIAVVNAGTAVTGAVAAMPVTLNELQVGGIDGVTGSNGFFNIQQVGYWSIAGTSAQLQTLTT